MQLAFGDHVEANPHLHNRGSVSVQAFYRALANSRFVVLPLQDDATCAAGVTLCSNVAPVRDAVSCGLVAQTRAMTRRMLCQV